MIDKGGRAALCPPLPHTIFNSRLRIADTAKRYLVWATVITSVLVACSDEPREFDATQLTNEQRIKLGTALTREEQRQLSEWQKRNAELPHRKTTIKMALEEQQFWEPKAIKETVVQAKIEVGKQPDQIGPVTTDPHVLGNSDSSRRSLFPNSRGVDWAVASNVEKAAWSIVVVRADTSRSKDLNLAADILACLNAFYSPPTGVVETVTLAEASTLCWAKLR